MAREGARSRGDEGRGVWQGDGIKKYHTNTNKWAGGEIFSRAV